MMELAPIQDESKGRGAAEKNEYPLSYSPLALWLQIADHLEIHVYSLNKIILPRPKS
jgi:hypothetical protein